jgi:hypothetical protein
MAQSIAIQIALEGGAEIERQLANIGDAGTKAFNDISKAAEQAGGFKQLKPEEVTAKLQEMGVTGADAIKKIQTAVTSAVRLEQVASGVNTAERAFTALGTAGAAAFSGIQVAGQKLVTGLNTVLSPLESTLSRRLTLGLTAAALGGAEIALIKFANAAETTQKQLAELQKVSGQSISNLSTMAIGFEQGGTSVKQFASEFGNLSDKIADERTRTALRNADKDSIQWANDIDLVARKFDNIALGARNTISPLATMQTRVEAVLTSIGKARAPQEQWLKLADIFKNLGSDLERAQLGKALGFSPETIQTLSQGSKALQLMQQQVQTLGLALGDLDQKNLKRLIESQNQAGALFDALKNKVGALAAPAIATFWEGFTAEIERLLPVFMQIGQTIGQIDFSRVGAAAADFLATLGKIAAGWAKVLAGNVSFSDVLSQAFQRAGQVLVNMAIQIGLAMGQAIVQGVLKGLSDLGDQIKRVFGENIPLPGGAPIGGPGGGIGSQASGGLISGRGTGTSDSNLAWVSRGEHIMPARAVAQPGVLAFLEALRRSGGNLSRVLDGMGRFAMGGLVRGPIPAFAGGGLVGGMNNVTIHFPGVPPVSGLRASSEVVDELRRSAALAQVRSGGRKPSRYS